MVVDVVCHTNPDTDEAGIDVYLRNMLISDYSIKPEHIVREAELFGPNLNLG
jgi:hypothetical protein